MAEVIQEKEVTGTGFTQMNSTKLVQTYEEGGVNWVLRDGPDCSNILTKKN